MKLQNDLRASRQKEGIYITQNQYDLYESNSILVDEQKMRIHNMEEQLERFKKKYVEQTEINKELEQKCNNLDIEKQSLQKDKCSLLSLIDEYLQNWGHLSNEITTIHENNITLLKEINIEMNGLCFNFNDNIEERRRISTRISEQTDLLKKLQNTVKDFNDIFETVLKGVNGEFDTRTKQFETDTLKVLDSIDIDSIMTSVERMKSSLESCFIELTEPRDSVIQPIYTTHRAIVENCSSDLKNSAMN